MAAILIVAKNNLHLTKNAVRTALYQDLPCDLFVIDNNSYDGTKEWLRTKKQVAYMSYAEDKSLAFCWNRGLTALYNTGATEVLVLNNDVEILPTTYSLLNWVNRPFVTAVGINSRDQFKPMDILSVPLHTRPHPDFSCFMIRPEVVDKVGGFNEDYFPAYVEDSEFHVRMHRAGIEAVCVDIPFFHAGAQTLANATPRDAAKIRHGADANRQRFKMAYGCLPGTKEYEELFSQAHLSSGDAC